MPPSIVVMSRMKKFSLMKRKEGGFGITFRGNRPVFVRSVDFDSHAHSAGLRSGDLLVQFNEKNVRLVAESVPSNLDVYLNRYSTKIEVLELLKSAKDRLHLTVVAGGLGPAGHSGTIERRERNRGRARAGRPLSQQRIELRYDKARVFHSKVSCLCPSTKKVHIHNHWMALAILLLILC